MRGTFNLLNLFISFFFFKFFYSERLLVCFRHRNVMSEAGFLFLKWELTFNYRELILKYTRTVEVSLHFEQYLIAFSPSS